MTLRTNTSFPVQALCVLALLSFCTRPDASEQLADTIARITPSIVGVGTYSAVRRPPAVLLGTGFVVGEGRHVATNFHVVSRELDPAHNEHLVVFIGRGREVEYRTVRITAKDEHHDLAVLGFEGAALPALALSTGAEARPGTSIAFTGFPIGAVLGLYPVTHHGIVSTLTPIATPVDRSGQLNIGKIGALRDPFMVLQLDATAYPGNSGSPVFLPDSGDVIGVINQVFVKGSKEDVLSNPSAITYAIPATHLETLLAKP